ncbi:hypothetical protein BJV77DRAFT_236816 [Russula vinacea]|nr:hypothetical protein BJV77DRAFT_236816 [Russula vinacea]
MCVGGFRGRPRHLLDCGMARRKVRGLCRNEDEKRMKHGRTSPYPRAPVIAPKNVAKASHLCPTDKSICTARFPLAPEHRRPPQLRFSKNDCSASSLTRWASPTQPPPSSWPFYVRSPHGSRCCRRRRHRHLASARLATLACREGQIQHQVAPY